MKTAIKKLFVLSLLFITFSSCTEDNTTTQQDSVLNLEFSKNDFNFDIDIDTSLLMKYNNLNDFNKDIRSKINFLINDVRDEIKNDAALANVSFTLVASNGEVRIEDIHTQSKNNLKINGMGNGACPKGSTYLGRCKHNGKERDCLANLIATHLSAALTSVGDCSQVRVSVGLFSTSVCSSPC